MPDNFALYGIDDPCLDDLEALPVFGLDDDPDPQLDDGGWADAWLLDPDFDE